MTPHESDPRDSLSRLAVIVLLWATALLGLTRLVYLARTTH